VNDEVQYIHMLPSPFVLVFQSGIAILLLWVSLVACALWWCVLWTRGGGRREAGLAYGSLRAQYLMLYLLGVFQIVMGLGCGCGSCDPHMQMFRLVVLTVLIPLGGGMACLAAATLATRLRFRVPPDLELLNVASVLASGLDLAATLICLELIFLA